MPRGSDIHNYDAVVIGSGIGGAMAAHRLAARGAKVAVVERGAWPHRDAEDWNPRSILTEQRYQGETLAVRQRGALHHDFMPMNVTVGGMSVFYGAASLRLRPRDFDHWPFGYDELEPFYTEAEQLLGVHGTAGADPHEPPRSAEYPFASIPYSKPAARIRDAGEGLGHKPFPIPLAIDFGGERGSRCVRCNTCDGFPCAIEAKNDAARLLREMEGVTVHTGIRIASLFNSFSNRSGTNGSQQWIVSAIGRDSEDEKVTFTAPVFILAAGTIGSPGVLLAGPGELPFDRDKSLAGRCLMRHCNAVVAGVFPYRTNPEHVFHKQVCFTDLYEKRRGVDGRAVGVIQDIYTPDARVVRKAAGGFASLLLRSPVVHRLQNLLCVAEDEPNPDNRVGWKLEGCSQAADGPVLFRSVEHHYREADEERLRMLTDEASRILRAAGALKTHVWPISSFSHAVGTLRMAEKPEDGPVAPDGRVFGFDNLFVTDGSVFPSSGGVNPSLTIAANALRVAEGIAQRGGR